MPVNLAEKWGLLPMNHYPELAGHKPADWDDFDSWPLKDDPEWAEVWRRNRSGNPLPIYEDFSPSSDFEGWEELEPQDNGLRTPDSTQSTPQVPLPSFVLRTPSPVRNGLPSPPPGDDIIFPQPARLESPETFLRAIRDKVKYPRRPVTRSTNSAGRYCSLSYKPGKIACLQDSDGIKESTYAELVWTLLIRISVIWSTVADGIHRILQPPSTTSTPVL